MKKLRVIVCGSTFGQFYMEALLSCSDYFQFVGILGTGSKRTVNCSKNYGVAYYSKIEELPSDIDLACVVVRSNVLGGDGTDIAIKLMERGIHVLQEHPSHPKDLEKCFVTSQKKGVCYQVGDLYTNLSEVKKFVECACHLNKIDRLVHIHVGFATQVSYPLIKILLLSLSGIKKLQINEIRNTEDAFNVLSGYINDVSFSMDVHNEVVHSDPNSYMYLLHSLTFFYEAGRLSLEDTFGPLVWVPRMHIPIECSNRGNLKGDYPKNVKEDSFTILVNKKHSFEQILVQNWPSAISEDLIRIYTQIVTGKKNVRNIQQEILCAKKWSELTKAIGYPSEALPFKYNTGVAEELEKICK